MTHLQAKTAHLQAQMSHLPAQMPYLPAQMPYLPAQMSYLPAQMSYLPYFHLKGKVASCLRKGFEKRFIVKQRFLIFGKLLG
ncbi:MAG: hypothetical protein LBI18_14510 [Planctomycetaceae bacterium]|nr:hypothetical protein [Planctomycetaceae bacterium]